MKQAKNWIIALGIIACLAIAITYQAKHSSIELIEEKNNLDTSALHPQNPGCIISTPDGVGLDLKNGGEIPKGTLISGQCFGVN